MSIAKSKKQELPRKCAAAPFTISSVMVYHRRMIRIGLITAEPRPA